MAITQDTASQYAAAADIGGTQMRAALISREGKVVRQVAIATVPERGIEDAAARLAAAVDSAVGDAAVVGLGVSTAGPVNPKTGEYGHPPNLTGWHGKTMKPLLADALGIGVEIGHDATLAAFAETTLGPHKGAQNLVYVTISTGIGGGIVANGDMVTGATGEGGEVGHITVRTSQDALACGVGCHGCFEGNASGPNIARMARAAVANDPDAGAALLEAAGGSADGIDARMVFEVAESGDALANQIVEQVIENVGRGLASIMAVLDPEAVVVGGGVVNSLSRRWDEVLAAVRTYGLPRYATRGVPVSVTELGEDVSLLGAAGLAFSRFDA